MCDLISGFIKNGKNVLLVSLEMSEKEMMKRIYANVFDIDVNHFSDLSKTSGELENFSDPVTKAQILSKYDSFKVGDRGKLFIKEYPTGSFSASMLESLVKKYQQQKNVKFDVILVDYLGIAKSDRVSPSAGLYSYVKAIGEEFRAAALNLGVVLISASQLNRCFSVYSNVITKNGVIQVKDLKIGDKVLTTNNTFNTVKNITEKELKKAFKIRTKSGKEIIVSEDHRIPTDKGLMSLRLGLKVGSKVFVHE